MERKITTSKGTSAGKSSPQSDSDAAGKNYEMLVFCHLRWGFVYQRPQHLISRMAQDYKILFVEEPVPFREGDEGTFELEEISGNLHVLRPKTRSISGIKEILQNFLQKKHFEVGWFYSAAFSQLLTDFSFDTTVYDCMDELSLFRGADPELIKQEKFLLSEADIVFTGGKSLYESKNKSHENVSCFQSSVEREHFAQAQNGVPVPEDLRNIEKPIVGYFGVIDERIDLELLHEVALLRPKINFVMIGPLAKISEVDLPRERNIHYLGMKLYKDLPRYLSAFDVAMMPFALNDATKFISPTKTLEYMAAGKPIVSTPVKDVERDYSHCIPLVRTAEEFSFAIDEMLETDQQALQRKYEQILDNTSWDTTAEKMKQLIKTTARG